MSENKEPIRTTCVGCKHHRTTTGCDDSRDDPVTYHKCAKANRDLAQEWAPGRWSSSSSVWDRVTPAWCPLNAVACDHSDVVLECERCGWKNEEESRRRHRERIRKYVQDVVDSAMAARNANDRFMCMKEAVSYMEISCRFRAETAHDTACAAIYHNGALDIMRALLRGAELETATPLAPIPSQ